MLTRTEAVARIEGELGDIFGVESERPDLNPQIVEAMTGNSEAMFRVPAADNGDDLFFDHVGMLTKFTSMTTPVQEQFLTIIRGAMKKNRVSEFHLTVPWTRAGATRILRIRSGRVAGDGPLDLYMR